MTLQFDHRHSARIVGIHRMIGERDAIAGWRESNVTDESGGLLENFPNRVLERFVPSHSPNDGEIAAVPSPIQPSYVCPREIASSPVFEIERRRASGNESGADSGLSARAIKIFSGWPFHAAP